MTASRPTSDALNYPERIRTVATVVGSSAGNWRPFLCAQLPLQRIWRRDESLADVRSLLDEARHLRLASSQGSSAVTYVFEDSKSAHYNSDSMGNNAPINPVKELGEHRIAVNTVAPGAIATDLSGGMVRDNPEINQRVVAMTVLGRACMPDDIGLMIASLLSDDNRWINAPRSRVAWRSNAEGVPPTSLGGTLIYHRHQIASGNTYLRAS